MADQAIFCVQIEDKTAANPVEFQYALKTFEKYCEKFNLDLILITKPKYDLSGKADYCFPILEKFQAYEILQKYKRIIKLDLDMMITAQCPNLFDVVPEDQIGVVYEDSGSRKKNRRLVQIKGIQKVYGQIPGWTRDYFNAGMMVMSRQHNDANLLTDIEKEVIRTHEDVTGVREQNILNWKVRHFGYKIKPLDYRYNHMSMFDEINLTNILKGSLFHDKLDHSYIIHYAGNPKIRRQRMSRDVDRIMAHWGL